MRGLTPEERTVLTDCARPDVIAVRDAESLGILLNRGLVRRTTFDGHEYFLPTLDGLLVLRLDAAARAMAGVSC